LSQRAHIESQALVDILRRQQATIDRALVRLQPDHLQRDGVTNKSERDQAHNDRKHLEQRMQQIESEVIDEPQALAETYEVCLQRLDPVGIVYLYPDALAGGTTT